jgi:DNA-binding SARP family transcriptional activator
MMELQVLGPVQLLAGGSVVPVEQPQQCTVLAALIVEAGRLVPVEVLVDRVWGPDPPQRARRTLHTYITRVRRLLEQASGAGDEAVRLVHRTGGYMLEVGPDRVDLHRFRRLLDRARDPSCGDEHRVVLLREALGLWRGEPLTGLPGQWAARTREGWRQQRLDAVLAWAQAELHVGNPAVVIPVLTDLLGEHPLVEPLTAALMRALHAAGRNAEALDRYTITRQRLVEELGVDPGAELQALHRAILRGDLDRTGSAPISAAARPALAVPAQLPAEVYGFVGRGDQLARLDAILAGAAAQAPTAVVISAVSGTAGVGKTALAVHWAHQVRDRYDHGQLHVNLRGYAAAGPLQPIEALARFLRALGVPADQVPVEVEEAAAMYRSLLADRRMLVLLDNAHTAEQVRPLLPGSPGNLVLVTSRDQLAGLIALDGARRLSVDVLTANEATALLGRILGADRVRAEPEPTAELAGLCSYLPLALRIAAAHLVGRPQATIAQYAAELRTGDRLAALTVQGDEQAAVRAAFSLSYAALPTAVRRLFRLLGLAPGPDVTAYAAAALAGIAPSEAAGLLDRLAVMHLVDQHQPGRYSFHDLLRLYAAEQCAVEDGKADRHAALDRLYYFYLYTSDTAARLLYPNKLRLPLSEAGLPAQPHPELPAQVGADHAGASGWLDAERANLVAAIIYAATSGPRPAAWLLADILRGHFQLGMYTVDWLSATQAGLTAAEASANVCGQAAAQISLADLAWAQADHGQALDRLTRAMSLARHAGWAEAEAAALGNLGVVHWLSGRLEKAADQIGQALALNRQIGAIRGRAANLANLGGVCGELGRLTQAADHFGDALKLYREMAARGVEGLVLANLGEVNHALGRFDEALSYLDQALVIHHAVGDRQAGSGSLCRLAAVHRDAGRLTQAADLADAALAHALEVGDQRSEARARYILGTVHRRLGRQQQAIECHAQALRMAGELDDSLLRTHALIGLAEHAGPDRYGEARNAADEALAISHKAQYRLLEGLAHTACAELEFAEGHVEQATEHARLAVAVQRETGHRLGEARARLVLGRLLHRAGRTGDAVDHWRDALVLFAAIGTPEADEVRGLLGAHPTWRR